MPELKPCACGSEPVMHKNKWGIYCRCHTCGRTSPVFFTPEGKIVPDEAIAEATEEWNDFTIEEKNKILAKFGIEF